jgi:hypothetical protein
MINELSDEAIERYERLALQYGVHARLEDAKVLPLNRGG